MKSSRSIILVVVSAKNDFNNQLITRYSCEIDLEGVRTLGLITGPDTLDDDSESKRFYIELAQNKDVKFRLRWYVLRNHEHSTRDSSLEARNRAEEQFFSSGIWRNLHPTQVGIHSFKHILLISHSFSDFTKAANDGPYSDPFFGGASTVEENQKRLRAVVQNDLTDYAELMRKKGHIYNIINEGSAKFLGQITRPDYISKGSLLLK